MKKIIMTIVCAIFMAFVGCKTTPTPSQVESTSYAIGVSTALVCNMTKIDAETAKVIVDIVNKVKYYTPEPGQPISSALNTIAAEYVNSLVKDGKLTEENAVVVLKVFTTVSDAVDYIVSVRWPTIVQYSNLTESALHGFCNGFLLTFNVDQTKLSTPIKKLEYDEDAYNYLMNRR